MTLAAYPACLPAVCPHIFPSLYVQQLDLVQLAPPQALLEIAEAQVASLAA